jgi:phosphomannomutase
MHALPPITAAPGPIRFGTDGWRGVIAADFTFERLYRAAGAAARALQSAYGSNGSREIVVGYDRRFLSPDFARTVAAAVAAVGLEPVLAETWAPTPAFSWAAFSRKSLGALVVTASHNPGSYSGLKLKSTHGGSVPPEVTAEVEALLNGGFETPAATVTEFAQFDPWPDYCHELQSKVDLTAIRSAIADGRLGVWCDPMHGAAAGGLARVLEAPVSELRSHGDPLFGGRSPEPLEANVPELCAAVREGANPLKVGIIFDGDGDRIAAVDADGSFFSSQILIPVLIEHLGERRGYPGELVKTVSGSDLMPKVAQLFGRAVFETPVGYKYIADRMLAATVLLGGEESGGIGYGHHIPERDALLAALYLLEAIALSGQTLGHLYASLQERCNFRSHYDRIDLALADMAARARVQQALETAPPMEIAGQTVTDCNRADGFKFRLADGRWLMVRFSGTEPLLRLYCEAADATRVAETLDWARTWAAAL